MSDGKITIESFLGNVPVLACESHFSIYTPSPQVYCKMSPQIKLTYFNFTGRGELARLIFHFGGVTFEDNRVDHAALATLKPTLPLGQLPVLEVDGLTYSQSMAIARYAAKVAGLYPEDPLLALGVDMISETLIELSGPMGEIVYRIKDEELKAEKIKTFLEVTLPKAFAVLESKVQGKFFLGDKASFADVHLFSFVSMITTNIAIADLSAFPKLLAVVEHVKANSGVAAYLAAQGQ